MTGMWRGSRKPPFFKFKSSSEPTRPEPGPRTTSSTPQLQPPSEQQPQQPIETVQKRSRNFEEDNDSEGSPPTRHILSRSSLPDNRATPITSGGQPGLITKQVTARNAIQQREGQQKDHLPAAHPNNEKSEYKNSSDEESDYENSIDEESDDTQWGLKIVKRQPASNPDAVDIVAIHGLGGNWKDTWTESGSKVNWLETLLSGDIPGARIMSYSYNSKEYFSKSNADIRDFALDFLVDYKSYRTSAAEKSRPIIFLCHSLGGIVFKQALITANEEPEYSNILGHVYGVFFFGTPHRGASLAAWKAMSANIVRSVSLNTSTNVISKDLKLRSEFLLNVADSWTHRGANLEIVSCYERQTLYGSIVVEKDSALLNWANERKVPMNADHRTICTFASRAHPEYRKVIYRLKQMTTRSVQKFYGGRKTLNDEQRQLLVILETSDYGSHLTEIVPHVQGTCRWILSTARYRDWDSSSTGRLLWISADAGCGKSVLAKYIIQNQRQHQLESNICFFIFRKGNPEQEDSVHALSAILHQICSFQPDLLEHVISKQKDLMRGQRLKTFDALWGVFEECIHDKRMRNTACIMDALDECEEKTRTLLVERLSLLFASSRRQDFKFKLIVTSRPDNVIKYAFGTITNIRLRGDDTAKDLDNDIRLFVQASVEEIVARSKFPPDLLAGLQDALIEGSDHTFLWTSLVIQLLKQGSVGGMSKTDLAGILRTRDIDDMYEHLLTGGRSSLKAMKARKILYIVVAAGRPLTLDELNVAVEVHQDYKRTMIRPLSSDSKRNHRRAAAFKFMDEASPLKTYGRVDNLKALEDRLHHPFSNHLRSICGHFLRVRGRKVYLVHQTARQFLLRKKSRENFSVGYYLRDFNWNVSCPTAKELQYMREHGIPGTFEGPKSEGESEPPPIFKNFILPEVSNRYLFQICVDYLGLFQRTEDQKTFDKRVASRWGVEQDMLNEFEELYLNHIPEMDELALEWSREIKQHTAGVFLEYASRYWVDHYRDVRADVDEVFDYMCKPLTHIFRLWILQHPQFKDYHNGRQEHGLDIAGAFRDDREGMACYGASTVSIEDVLDYFDLNAEVDEQWYDDNICGTRYWEQEEDVMDSNHCDVEDLGVKSNFNESLNKSRVPNRIRAYRRDQQKNSKQLPYLISGSNPGTAGHSFPVRGNSLRFSSVSPRILSLSRDSLRRPEGK